MSLPAATQGSRTRRPAGVALLALGLALLGVLAAAGEAHRAARIPDLSSAGPADPRPGDRGLYVASTVRRAPDGRAVVLDEHPWLTFEWLGPQHVFDAQGGAHSARPVAVHLTDAPIGGRAEPVRSVVFWDGDSVVSRTDAVDAGTRGATALATQRTLTRYEVADAPACLFLLAAPGGVRFPRCILGDAPAPMDVLRPRTSEDVAGLRAIVHEGAGGVAWIAPDVPGVLRFVRPDGADPTLFHVVRLARFDRGPIPYAVVASQAPIDLSLSGRDPWGPAEVGVEHPFPLSAAYRFARDDPLHPELRTFLSSHADAVVVRASYAERPQRGTVARTWLFDVASGMDAIHVDLQAAGTDADGLGAHGLPPYEYGPSSFSTPSGLRLPVAAGARAPTVASLMRAWAAYAPSDLPANRWGIEPRCDENSCWVEYWAGRSMAEGASSASSRLFVDDQGRVQRLQDDQAAFRDPNGEDATARAVGPAVAAKVLDQGGWRFPRGLTAAVGVAAAATGLLVLFGSAIKSLFLRGLGSIGLYSRIERTAALDHAVRQQIHAAIEATPGIHYRELTRILGLAQGVAQHHLRTLVANGLVVASVGRGYTCYFLPGQADRCLMGAAAALKSEGARRVLLGLQTGSGSSVAELALAARLDRRTVQYHVRRLESLGLVAPERSGRRVLLRLTELGRDALLSSWSPAQGDGAAR